MLQMMIGSYWKRRSTFFIVIQSGLCAIYVSLQTNIPNHKENDLNQYTINSTDIIFTACQQGGSKYYYLEDYNQTRCFQVMNQ